MARSPSPTLPTTQAPRKSSSASRNSSAWARAPPFDHPHVYLDMGEDSQILCPYCSTLYVHDPRLDARRERSQGLCGHAARGEPKRGNPMARAAAMPRIDPERSRPPRAGPTHPHHRRRHRGAGDGPGAGPARHRLPRTEKRAAFAEDGAGIQIGPTAPGFSARTSAPPTSFARTPRHRTR